MVDNLCQLYIRQKTYNQKYRELKKLNSQKINDPMKKWANELNTVFSKENIQMPKKTHEKMLTIPGHKRNANSNQLRFYLSPVRIATSRTQTTTNVGEDAGKRSPHTLLLEM
jgi:hypothetical protein